MQEKLERAFGFWHHLYELPDVMERIHDGRFQSFAGGDTWVVTEVAVFPKGKVLNIVLIVGHLQEYFDLLPRIEEFGREQGCFLITGTGRSEWELVPQPGWKKVASLYAKEL